MAPTKEETTDLVPLEQEVGGKLASKLTEAQHVTIATPEDPTVAAMQIVSRILDTRTLEESTEVFTGGTISTRDLAGAGTVVELRAMTLRPSDFTDSDKESPRYGQRGWYAQFEAVNTETGEAIIVNTSSRSVMAQFVAADAAGLIPARCAFVAAERNERGFEPIHAEWVTE